MPMRSSCTSAGKEGVRAKPRLPRRRRGQATRTSKDTGAHTNSRTSRTSSAVATTLKFQTGIPQKDQGFGEFGRKKTPRSHQGSLLNIALSGANMWVGRTSKMPSALPSKRPLDLQPPT